jgi:N-6 DNA Methylase
MVRGQQQASDMRFDETAGEQSQQAKEASTILINRNLFSSYYLGTLFDKAVRAQQGETGTRMPRRIRERLQERWDKYTPTFGSSTSYSRTREAWLDTLLIALGYEPLDTAHAEMFKEATLPDGYFLYHPAHNNQAHPDEIIKTAIRKVAEASIVYPPSPIESSDTDHPTPIPLFDTPEDDALQEDGDTFTTDSEENKDQAVLISLLSWGADFDRPFTSKARRNEMPHKLMERLLASGGSARWGILCNGRRIRLLKRDVVAGRQHYFEVDLEALFDNHNEQDAGRKEQGFDTFWTLFRAQSFQLGADGHCLLDILEQESRKHAEGVSARLKTSVFQALETLMSELVNRARMLNTPPVQETGLDPRVQAREQRTREMAEQALKDLPILYTQSLVYLYRLLFVLYAESRDLLPVDNAVYRDAYSLEPLRAEIELPDAETRYQPDSFRLWETLQALFRMIHRGCNTTQLVVPAYNGNLFDPHSVALLHTIRISDRALYKMLLPLSVTPPTKDRGRERIDYRDLGVEQLGSVYEGLLEFEPRVATEPMVEVRYKDVHVIIPTREQRDYKVERDVESGQFYLGRGAGRKTSGSYYTPQPLVDFLVERTLKPLVEGKKPEEILELKVVDPAMGSGAFLVGACLYLADAYARAVREQEQLNGNQHNNDGLATNLTVDTATADSVINSESAEEDAEIEVQEAEEAGELLEEATRPYRRLVAERCLYGVDLNPMAVELAKVSLWLTTLAGDKPLTFLDANLRCGNSLIGAPLLPYRGITSGRTYTIEQMHPEANKRLLKMRGAKISNKKNEDDAFQLLLFDQDALPHEMEPLVSHRRLIAETPSDTVTQVHDKAAIFRRQIEQDTQRSILKTICDLWIAAWFWRQPSKDAKSSDINWIPPLDGAIYRQLVKQLRGAQKTFSDNIFCDYMKELDRVNEQVRPFHWELEFPEVYFTANGKMKDNPGFDAVLGNPPWDLILPNSREFFVAYDPAFRELERAIAEQRQEELLRDHEIRNEWEIYSKNLDSQIDYFRLGEAYPYQLGEVDGKAAKAHGNTYKLFLERGFNLLSNKGKCGLIVPSGIYTDQGCTGLRQLFLSHAQINYLLCFENRYEIFPIHRSFKFVLFGFCKQAPQGSFATAFMLHNLEILTTIEEYTLSIPEHLIKRFSPDTLSIMEFRSQRDLDIIKQIYGDLPLLKDHADKTWTPLLRSEEFNMTHSRAIFNEDSKGWPLYEGKMIHQYTHHFSGARYWIDPLVGRKELANKELQRAEEAIDALSSRGTYTRHNTTRQARIKDFMKINNRGSLVDEEVHIDSDTVRLVFRSIARNTDERTMIAAILPQNLFIGNSLNHFSPWQFDAHQAIHQLKNIKSCYKLALSAPVLTYLCGILNSFALDYVLRFKITANVNIFYVYQLPIPRLTPEDLHCRAIAHRVAKLVCIGPEFDDLRRELLGDVNAHVATIQDERQKLQNEIDALVAHLYGLRREDLEHILYAPYTFPLVKQGIKDGVMAAFERVEELLEREI